MRTEEKMVTRKVVTYIANDGTEFACKETCELYERDLAIQKCCDVVKNLPNFACSPEDVDMNYSIKFYFVRNEEDLDAVKRYSFYDDDAQGWSFEAPAYPCWIRVLVNGDTGCGYISTFDEEVASAEGYVRELKEEKARVEAMMGGGKVCL